jgi:NADPH:quinone reductase-like Zn-dependent oxidoreductase
MERVAVEIHPAQGLITYPTAFFIALRVEAGPDRQAGLRFRVADQVHDGYPVEQGATSPIRGNEAEHTMLDLVPLARTGRKMRNMDCEVKGIGGLGHLGVQFARHMGFRTVAIGRGREKEPLARELGAHVYLDAAAGDAAAELQRMGGARAILATGTSGEAMGRV